MVVLCRGTSPESVYLSLKRSPANGRWTTEGCAEFMTDEEVLMKLDSMCPTDYDNMRLRKASDEFSDTPAQDILTIVRDNLSPHAKVATFKRRYTYFDAAIDPATGAVAKSDVVQLEVHEDNYYGGKRVKRAMSIKRTSHSALDGIPVKATAVASRLQDGYISLTQRRSLLPGEIPLLDNLELEAYPNTVQLDITEPEELISLLATSLSDLRSSRLGSTH